MEIGDTPQLFFDTELLTAQEGMQIHMHRPTPTGRQLIVADQPWENVRFWAYNSVVDNGTHVLYAPYMLASGLHSSLDASDIVADRLYYYIINAGDPAHPLPAGQTQTYT